MNFAKLSNDELQDLLDQIPKHIGKLSALKNRTLERGGDSVSDLPLELVAFLQERNQFGVDLVPHLAEIVPLHFSLDSLGLDVANRLGDVEVILQ